MAARALTCGHEHVLSVCDSLDGPLHDTQLDGIAFLIVEIDRRDRRPDALQARCRIVVARDRSLPANFGGSRLEEVNERLAV